MNQPTALTVAQPPVVVLIDDQDQHQYLPRNQTSHLARHWDISDHDLYLAWIQQRDHWLDAPKGRGATTSTHTRAAYAKATRDWLAFLTQHQLYPWEATTEHARSWMAWLQASGLSDATVALRLAAVSSWYSFVINDKHLANGIERCLFEDARGIPRENPFRANQFKRPAIDPFDKARLLPLEELQKLFRHLLDRSDTLSGARNYALLLGHATTGARSSELCCLTWGAIQPNWDQPGAYTYKWQGKGGKSAPSALPEPVYHAIVAYLKKAGRYLTGQPAGGIDGHEYIFPPLSTNGIHNLRHTRPDADYADDDYTQRHISSKNVQRIFKTSLKRAGIHDWDQYRIHDLRHTLAVMVHRNGGDIYYIKTLLHHSNIAVTEIYLRDLSRQMTTDKNSAQVVQQLGLPLAMP